MQEEKWIYYKNTQAVGLKLKHDLDLIKVVVDLALQLIFLAYYLVLAIVNLGNTFYHIVYALFFIFALGYLVIHILPQKNIKKEFKASIKNIIRYIKYPIRFCLIGLAVYTIIKGNARDLSIISTICSSICLIIQILVNLIIKFCKKYVEMFSESLKMDYENSTLIKATVNYKLYGDNITKQPKKKGLGGSILEKGLSVALEKLNNFINENKDIAPEKELTHKSEMIRKNISEIKDSYFGQETLQVNDPVLEIETTELPVKEIK